MAPSRATLAWAVLAAAAGASFYGETMFCDDGEDTGLMRPRCAGVVACNSARTVPGATRAAQPRAFCLLRVSCTVSRYKPEGLRAEGWPTVRGAAAIEAAASL
jgi:hypothetical protein